jgi:hypothetical protein
MSQFQTPHWQAMSPDELINGISGLFSLEAQNAFYRHIMLQNTSFLGGEEEHGTRVPVSWWRHFARFDHRFTSGGVAT